MDMSGEQVIAVSRDRVWAGLNDPDVLKACIPGCESVERVTDAEYRVVIVAAVGPVKAKFTGKILLEDLDPPNGYRIVFEGAGGPAGFAKGSARVALEAMDGSTRLAYAAQAQIGGKLAQVGSRLVDAVARKTADEFFQKFNAHMSPGTAQAPASDASSGADRKWLVWAAIAIALILLVLVMVR